MRDFKIVDVFSDRSFRGNPLAVVMNAIGISDAQMAAIAAWTNLSETAFCLPPGVAGADYRLRIFTPHSELPFAGHPTLGSAHALLEAGMLVPHDGYIVQECRAGLVPIAVDAEETFLQLEMPPAAFADLSEEDVGRLGAALSLSQSLSSGPVRPALVDVGARWIVAEMEDADAVIALSPDLLALAVLASDLNASGVSVFGRYASGPAEIEVRSFAPHLGISEDPVCGSGNGAVAAFRRYRALVPEEHAYLALQGRCVGRDGHIRMKIAGDRVFVGGAAVTTVNGTLAG